MKPAAYHITYSTFLTKKKLIFFTYLFLVVFWTESNFNCRSYSVFDSAVPYSLSIMPWCYWLVFHWKKKWLQWIALLLKFLWLRLFILLNNFCLMMPMRRGLTRNLQVGLWWDADTKFSFSIFSLLCRCVGFCEAWKSGTVQS